MKCPVCWAEKAYAREVRGWRGILLACLLLVPMKCHHCYHKFHVPWFMTFGKKLTPPTPGPQRPTGAFLAAHQRQVARRDAENIDYTRSSR